MLLFLAGLFASGCASWPRAAVRPMPVVASTPAPTAPTLVVFLPGRGDSREDFERQGMAAALRAAGVRADWIATDAHLGYYLDRSIVNVLREEVLRPARARGYRRIVLVGISLGGLGALLCVRDAPELVDGVVLIAPYLGDRAALFTEIDRAGGPAAWAEGRSGRQADVAAELWTFLGQRHAGLPPTWLAAGEADRLAQGHRLLAPLLSPERVRLAEGGHVWSVWRGLWTELCARSDLFAAERLPAPPSSGPI